jgi:hypothetical protein
LYRLREESGVTDRNPGCWTCDTVVGGSCVGDPCVNFSGGGETFEQAARDAVKEILESQRENNQNGQS